MDKEVKKLVAALTRIDGIDVRPGGNHLKVYREDKFVTTLPVTPSDNRWKANAMADLRRQGITPATSPEKLQRPTRTIPLDELRSHLRGLRARREMAAFSRFAQQLGEVRGMRVYANLASAESSIGAIAAEKTDRPSDWSWRLLSQAWLEWSRKPKEEPHAEEPPVEQAPDPEQAVAEVGNQTRVLVIDLDSVVELLGRLGIRAEVK